MWRKSSYSGGSGGDCVEVRDDTGRVLVRDTKDRIGPVLPFTPQAWRRFADRVKRSLAGPRARHLRAPSRLEGARSAVLTKPTLLPWLKIGPVIATISGRRRDATVSAMHAERRLWAGGWLCDQSRSSGHIHISGRSGFCLGRCAGRPADCRAHQGLCLVGLHVSGRGKAASRAYWSCVVAER